MEYGSLGGDPGFDLVLPDASPRKRRCRRFRRGTAWDASDLNKMHRIEGLLDLVAREAEGGLQRKYLGGNRRSVVIRAAGRDRLSDQMVRFAKTHPLPPNQRVGQLRHRYEMPSGARSQQIAIDFGGLQCANH